MKTVLAPNAPWPTHQDANKSAVSRRKNVPPKPDHSKRKIVDQNFERWLSTLKPIKVR